MRTERIVRRAAGWRTLRPSGENLSELADLVLGVTRDDAELATVVYELAMWSRFAEAVPGAPSRECCAPITRHAAMRGALHPSAGRRPQVARHGGVP
jgi:hypothetical protein